MTFIRLFGLQNYFRTLLYAGSELATTKIQPSSKAVVDEPFILSEISNYYNFRYLLKFLKDI